MKVPSLPGIQHTFNLDSYNNAQRLEDHIFELAKNDFYHEGASTFVVVGSGFSGLETVTAIEQKARTVQAYHSGKEINFRIVLLKSYDKNEMHLSKECVQYIRDVLASKNIEVISKHEVAAIEIESVLLDNGTRISTRTVIWTEGQVASSLTQFFKGAKDDLNRLTVNKFLKLPEYILRRWWRLGSMALIISISGRRRQRSPRFQSNYSGSGKVRRGTFHC